MADFSAQKTFGIFANQIARKIIGDFESANADVLLFPPIEIEKIVLDKKRIEILQNLTKFDWLIFTDVLAVDAFLEQLEANKVDLFELDALRICAVGETVSDQLRFSSIHSDVVPPNLLTENILTAIRDYAGEDNFENLRFLFPKENSAVEKITEKLREKKAFVLEMPVYAARLATNLEITKLKTLLINGAIDEFVFTAPTDFIALKHYFKTVEIAGIFADVKVSAADSLILQSARENNLSRAGLFFLAKH